VTGYAAVDQAGPAEAEHAPSPPVGLTMLGSVGSVAGDSAITDGHCDDGYCAVP